MRWRAIVHHMCLVINTWCSNINYGKMNKQYYSCDFDQWAENPFSYMEDQYMVFITL